MRRTLLTGTGLWLAFFATACSGDDTATNNTGAAGAAGAVAGGGAIAGSTADMASAGAPDLGACPTPPCTEPGAAGAADATAGAGPAAGTGPTGDVGAMAGADPVGAAGATGDVVGAAGTPADMGAAGATGGAAGATGDVGAAGMGVDDMGAAGMGMDDMGAAGSGDPVEMDPAGPEPTLITSGNNAFWQIGEPTEVDGNATVTVNEAQTFQRWDGFGGTFNEMGWDALLELSQADRDRAIKLLFDKEDGAAFTYGRIPIGSSDYGNSRYSLAETSPVSGSFTIQRDREMLIPYIKAAQAVQPNIIFWGSPWSPPPWMKDNNAFDRGAILDSALPEHAEYMTRFVEEYANEGIPIKALHPQNEPGWAQDYPSCAWTSAQFVKYIGQDLGPLLASRAPDTEIWIGTMSNSSVGPGIVSAVMGDATARGYVKGIGLQWGMGDGSYPSDYASTYNVPIMQTEHRCGNYPFGGGLPGTNENQSEDELAPNDYAYGVETWDLFKNWIGKSVNSYLAWNMVLDQSGMSLDTERIWHQNALLVVNRSAKSLILTPAYYVFRHLAQYVEPGATRIGLSNGADGLAFKNPDGSIVTVLHSTNGGQTTLAVGGKNLQFTIPQNGWATVNFQP